MTLIWQINFGQNDITIFCNIFWFLFFWQFLSWHLLSIEAKLSESLIINNIKVIIKTLLQQLYNYLCHIQLDIDCNHSNSHIHQLTCEMLLHFLFLPHHVKRFEVLRLGTWGQIGNTGSKLSKLEVVKHEKLSSAGILTQVSGLQALYANHYAIMTLLNPCVHLMVTELWHSMGAWGDFIASQ